MKKQKIETVKQRIKDYELVDELEDKIRSNRIATIDELLNECLLINERVGYDMIGQEILNDMEWNCCDLCGALYPSEELCWTDYLDPDYDNDLIKAIGLRGVDVCTICYKCVKEMKDEAK